MLHRHRSASSRLFDALPLVLVLAMAMGGVFVAMNILVIATPVAIQESASPSVSPVPSPVGSPSMLPSASDLVSPSVLPTASLPPGKPVIIRSVVSAADPDRVWTVYLEYPSFQAGSTPFADVMNTDLANEMQNRADSWEAGAASIRQVRDKTNVLAGSYKVEFLTSGIAAFTLNWTDNSTAEGTSTFVETINFDLSNGQRIDFDSMFTDVQLALTEIQASALSQLQAQLGPNFDESVVNDGLAPVRASFVNWAITTAGLKITFNEHQVSLAAGLVTVVVPWSVVRDALATTGPVAQLLGLAAQ